MPVMLSKNFNKCVCNVADLIALLFIKKLTYRNYCSSHIISILNGVVASLWIYFDYNWEYRCVLASADNDWV